MGNIHIETYVLVDLYEVLRCERVVLYCDNGFAYLELMTRDSD